jgi:glycosyltransferase involved in cell wall biosynthesis
MIDLNRRIRVLWLGPILDEATLHVFPAVSPAANRWQQALVLALSAAGADTFVIQHVPEPAWPRGKFWLDRSHAALPFNIDGSIAGYFNVPGFRFQSIARGYRQEYTAYHAHYGRPDFLCTYNSSLANDGLARYLRERYGVPWITIVADGEAPQEADGLVFLSWGYFTSFRSDRKLHLDGGVSRLPAAPPAVKAANQSQVILYSGAMTKYGGVELLVKAFEGIANPHVELWLCGKGQHQAVEQAVARDARIKCFGFVAEEELVRLSTKADMFINPRPSSVPGNEKNFPSKVLEYLTYGKPVVSTWTPGLAPEYRDVLFVLDEETPECLAHAIHTVLQFNSGDLKQTFFRTQSFLESSRTWQIQASRLLAWLTQTSLLSRKQ